MASRANRYWSASPLLSLLLAVIFLDASNQTSAATPAPEEVSNRPEASQMAASELEFRNNNPGYQERAGAFYELEYLPKAVSQLTKAAHLTEQETAAARKILRGFTYDFLERYVHGGGRIAREELMQCLAQMDQRMQLALPPAGFAAYLDWRKDETGADNAMAFLMNPRFAVQPAPATQPAASPAGGE